MTREEQKALKRQRLREQRRKEREAWEAARGPLDLPFLLLVLVLLVIGLIMLLSASFPSAQAEPGGDPLAYFKRQGIFAILGLVAMFWVSKINYQRFRGLARIAIVVSVVLLLLVLIPGVGITRNNATRWLGIPGTEFQFQPSEVAKLGVIVYFAASISKKREKMGQFRTGILPYGLLLGFISLLVLMEPHMSGAVLLLGIGAMMMVVGGIDWRWIAAGVGAVGFGAYLMLFTDLMEKIGYNSDRIATWRDAFWDAKDKSYHGPELYHHRLRGPAGGGPGQEPPEVHVPAGGAQRLYFRCGLRGAGAGGGHPHHAALFPPHHPGLLAGHPRKGPVRQPSGGGRYHPDRFADLSEHRRGHGADPGHWHLPALLQLRRHRSGHPAGGGGGGAVGVQADSRAQKRVIGLTRL